MATTYGLTDLGLVIKTLTIIRADLEAAMRAAFGASLKLGDTTLLGQICGIMAERYAELWSLLQAVYASQDPNAATGLSLDNVSAITGTTRPPASYSTVTLTGTGTPSTVVPASTQVETASTAIKFTTTVDTTLVAVTAWAASHSYVVGDRVTNGGNVYQCTIAGISAGSGGPSGTGTAIVDNFATWTYVGAGTAAADIPAQAVNTGDIAAAARDLTVIDTPVAGLSNIINLLDAARGRDVATDEELRLLREAELSGDGVSTADAIEAAVLQIANVVACTVYVNDTDTTNVDGMPPHSVEVVVLGGLDQDIANTLFAEVAAGIATHSSSSNSATIVDSQGVSHTIYFTRPAQILVYVDLTLTYDAKLYPSDGDAEVQAAITAFGAKFPSGKDVTATGVGAQAFTVPGVLDATPVKIGTSPSPTGSTTISVSTRQLAVFDTSRITIHSSAATP